MKYAWGIYCPAMERTGKPLDSKDRKPARPSLFEPGPAPGGPAEARAPGSRLDIELASPRRSQARWPRIPRWALLLGVVVTGIAGWALLSGGGGAEPVQMAHVPAPSSGIVDRSSTAMLVEGGTARPGQAFVDAEAGEGGDMQPGEPGSDLAARLGLVTETSPAATASASRASTPGTRRSARPRASTSDEKADLLAVLMANIREQPEKAASTGPQTLDELVAQLRETPTTGSASAGSGDVAVANQSSANLQRQLRSCPAANTTAGIRCRQRLCAKHRGDPACPMQ